MMDDMTCRAAAASAKRLNAGGKFAFVQVGSDLGSTNGITIRTLQTTLLLWFDPHKYN